MRMIAVLLVVEAGCAAAPTRLSQRPTRNTLPTSPTLVRVEDDVEDLVPRAAQAAMLMGMLPAAIEKNEGHLEVHGTWLDDWATANAEASRLDELEHLSQTYGPGMFGWSQASRRIRRLEAARPQVYRTLTISTVISEGTATVSASVVSCEREREDLPMRCKDPHGKLAGPEIEAFRIFLRALKYTDKPEPKPVVRYFGPSPV